MKKIYMSLVAATLASGVVAQSITSPVLPAKKNNEISTLVKPAGQNYTKGAVLWSNTCSDINDFTLTNASSPALDWSIETDPNASPRPELNPLGFTTVGDGFLFINSDAAGGTATQDATAEITATPTLPATTFGNNINLVYETVYRNYVELRTVSVSTDNWLTQTDYVIHDGSSAVNTNTANPETTVLNISAAAGGAAAIQIRFRYQGAWDWFWSIDDIRIEETDDNDVRVDGVNFGTMGAYGLTLPYYQIPLTQAQPIDLYSVVTNIGAVDQTNTTLTADITGAGTFTGTSAAGFTSVTGSTDTLNTTTMFTPAALGVHDIAYNVTMDNTDSDVSNNTGALAFEVTNDIYARDNGVADGGSFNSGEAYELGNVFDIFAADDLYAVNIKLNTATEGNPLIFGKIYGFDPVDGSRIFLDQTDDYSVTAAEITAGAEISLAFNSPVTLNAGESYLLVVGSYGDAGATNDLVIETAGESEPQTSNLYDEPTTTWFYVTGTPWVRMNFNASSSVEEIVEGNVTVSQNYPNPFNGVTSVNYTLTSTDEVMVQITDVTGKVIEVMNEGVRTAGSHVLTINSNKLAAGTYYYTISTSNGKVTKAMNVTK